MTDTSALPYIDLGASADTLRSYAQDHFGKKISSQAKDETVRSRFADIYEEETGTRLAEVSLDLDGEDFDKDPEDEEAKAIEAAKPKPRAYKIVVQDDQNDPHPITGGVNFVSYRIIRNKEAIVSPAILESLRNAKKEIFDPDTMVGSEVPQYPFSIVEVLF